MAAGASANGPTRLELANAILDISFPEDMRLAMFQTTSKQMEAQMMQSLSGVITDEGALELVSKWQAALSPESDALLKHYVPLIMEAWAVSYAQIHSEQELEDILAFVKTPSGQAFMQRSTDILSHPAFAEANQAYINATTELVMERIPDLVQALQSYQASKATDEE
ncbi:MAG: hypothetical protein AAGI28_05340 [Pseudomonadota bacterium]